jgi:REP element-mobilizing transposase RayT
MAFVNIMIHAVWGTKNRVHFLTDELRLFIINLFRQNAIFLSLSFLLKESNQRKRTTENQLTERAIK